MILEPRKCVPGPGPGMPPKQERKEQREDKNGEGRQPTGKEREQKTAKDREKAERPGAIRMEIFEEKRKENMKGKYVESHQRLLCRTPPKVKAIISEWERELNSNIENEEIQAKEWDTIVKGPGNTRGCQTLFRQTIQQYWVMKNILAKAMTTYKEREELEEDRPTKPSLKDLQKEIQSV